MIVKKYKGFDVPDGATYYNERWGEFYKEEGGRGFIYISHSDDWCSFDLEGNRNFRDSIVLPQEPEAYIPQVGEECEVLIIKWEPVMPLFVGQQVVVVEIATAEISYSISAMEFRPIKTERERVIEFAMSKWEEGTHGKVLLGHLYDKGALKMPDNHE